MFLQTLIDQGDIVRWHISLYGSREEFLENHLSFCATAQHSERVADQGQRLGASSVAEGFGPPRFGQSFRIISHGGVNFREIQMRPPKIRRIKFDAFRQWG